MNRSWKPYNFLGLFFVVVCFVLAAIASSFAGNTNVAKKCYQLYSQKKYKEAFPYCKQAAEQGDAKAQLNLG